LTVKRRDRSRCGGRLVDGRGIAGNGDWIVTRAYVVVTSPEVAFRKAQGRPCGFVVSIDCRAPDARVWLESVAPDGLPDDVGGARSIVEVCLGVPCRIISVCCKLIVIRAATRALPSLRIVADELPSIPCDDSFGLSEGVVHG
jgi:hypothetical protein